jgi:hypothetical protein
MKAIMSAILFLAFLILLPSSIAAAFNIGEIVFKVVSYVIGGALFAGAVLLLAAGLLGQW